MLAQEKTSSPDICTGIERFETVLNVRRERRRIRFEPGTLVVHTGQRLGNLVIYLLEPESDDGFARWEFFDRDVIIGEPFPVYRVTTPVRLPVRLVGSSPPSLTLPLTPLPPSGEGGGNETAPAPLRATREGGQGGGA